MHSCHEFKCDVERTLKAWLQLHELLMEDLPQLEHHIVIQSEYIYLSPEPVLDALKKVIGWDHIEVVDTTGEEIQKPQFADIMTRSAEYASKVQKARAELHNKRESMDTSSLTISVLSRGRSCAQLISFNICTTGKTWFPSVRTSEKATNNFKEIIINPETVKHSSKASNDRPNSQKPPEGRNPTPSNDISRKTRPKARPGQQYKDNRARGNIERATKPQTVRMPGGKLNLRDAGTCQ